jgi:hypothetical protein
MQLGRGFPVLTGKYSTEGRLVMHKQERTSQLGRGFPVLTGKYVQHRREAGHAQTGKNITAWQRFSCFDRQIQHRRHSNSYIHRQERTAQPDVFLF